MKLTREYVGGIIAGCGMGTLMTSGLVQLYGWSDKAQGIMYLTAPLFILIGVSLARAGQRDSEPKHEI